MFAYGGHGAFPTIQHDMKHPHKFDKAVTGAFTGTNLFWLDTFAAGDQRSILTGIMIDDKDEMPIVRTWKLEIKDQLSLSGIACMYLPVSLVGALVYGASLGDVVIFSIQVCFTTPYYHQSIT